MSQDKFLYIFYKLLIILMILLIIEIILIYVGYKNSLIITFFS
ncbi:hypothetical protein CLOHAE12215_01584 [Clostridium haemolyticum]|nr:hypothetical protein CLOHAE12215_01584 [Clostridium haemolyticum]